MTDHAQSRFWSGIDIPKTLAGTLAAVSAAVVGSFLGLTGTIIGAGLAAVISSIGTEVYHRSFNQGTKRLQSAFVAAPAAVGTPEVAAAHTPPSGESEDDKPDTSTAQPRPSRGPINWKRVSLVAAALFVVALGTLTALETMAGKTAADAVNGRDGGSPTLLNFSRESKDADDTAPVAPEQSQAPADAGETSAPATEPATEPSETTTPGTETTAPAPDTTTAPTEPPATVEEPPADDETGETGDTGDTGTGQDGTGARDQTQDRIQDQTQDQEGQ